MSDRRLADMDPALPTTVMFGDSLTGSRSENMEPDLPKVIMFGASISEYSFFVPNGVGEELTQKFKGKANVLNFGFAGRTSANLRNVFKNEIVAKLSKAPVLVTIWLGANDATFGPANVPIDKFETYIREYIDQLIKHPTWEEKPKVLLLTPPPIDLDHRSSRNKNHERDEPEIDLGPAMEAALRKEREAAEQGIGHRTWKSKRAYAERVLQIADSYTEPEVAGLDVWTVFTQAACDVLGQDWQEGKLPGCGLPGTKAFPEGFLTDGLHLGSKGYQVVTKALLEKIEQTWPQLLESLS